MQRKLSQVKCRLEKQVSSVSRFQNNLTGSLRLKAPVFSNSIRVLMLIEIDCNSVVWKEQYVAAITAKLSSCKHVSLADCALMPGREQWKNQQSKIYNVSNNQ